MVRNMNNSKIKDRKILENIFCDLNIEYEYIDMDDDLNYLITFEPGKLKESIGGISIFMFYSYESKALVTVCNNIYKLKKGDSTLNILNALNTTNKKLSKGNVVLDNNDVRYRCLEQAQVVKDITKDIIKDIMFDILAAVLYTYNEIKKIKNEK